jgi:hypothetical protein
MTVAPSPASAIKSARVALVLPVRLASASSIAGVLGLYRSARGGRIQCPAFTLLPPMSWGGTNHLRHEEIEVPVEILPTLALLASPCVVCRLLHSHDSRDPSSPQRQ